MLLIAIGIEFLCVSTDSQVIVLTIFTHSCMRFLIFSGSSSRKYVFDIYRSSSEYAFPHRDGDHITGAYFGLSFQISLYWNPNESDVFIFLS